MNRRGVIMNPRIALIATALALGTSVQDLMSQTFTAVPYLSITSSPRANGMGGVGATVPALEASAATANPGQIGLFSLENLFAASTYAPKTVLYPTIFPGDVLTMDVSALSAGYNFSSLLSLPFSAGLGIGYSRTFVDLGSFNVTGPAGPTVIARVPMNDTYENFSIGVGLEYYVKLGIGFNFKKIVSRIPAIGPGGVFEYAARPAATDFGVLLQVPVADIVWRESDSSREFEPLLNFSMSYVKANVGDEVRYFDPAQGDPLPRTALAGLGCELGLTARSGNARWTVISVLVARQGEDPLVTYGNGTFGYKSGLGDLKFADNVLGGTATGDVQVHEGWQLGVAEFLFIRGGSVKGILYDYSTSGYGICLAGLLRLLEFASPAMAGNSWIAFAGDHLDLQYNSSTYDRPGSPWDRTTFRGLNLVVRGLPW
jgi:hypothetical protein